VTKKRYPRACSSVVSTVKKALQDLRKLQTAKTKLFVIWSVTRDIKIPAASSTEIKLKRRKSKQKKRKSKKKKS